MVRLSVEKWQEVGGINVWKAVRVIDSDEAKVTLWRPKSPKAAVKLICTKSRHYTVFPLKTQNYLLSLPSIIFKQYSHE